MHILLLVLLACAPPSARVALDAAQVEAPLPKARHWRRVVALHYQTGHVYPPPDDLRDVLARAERIAPLLLEMEAATDGAVEAISRVPGAAGDPRLRGWLTVRDGPRCLVHFLGAEQQSLYRFAVEARSAPVQVGEPGRAEPLTDLERAMLEAVRVATRTRFDRHVSMYRAEVLPGELRGTTGWLVYLLADSADPGLAMAGGDTLMTVHQGQVREVLPLSTVSTSLPRVGSGIELEAIFVADPGIEAPNEAHVLASMRHALPLFVGTARGVWRVDGGRILFLGGGPASPG